MDGYEKLEEDAALVLCERRSQRHEMIFLFFFTTFNEITRTRGRGGGGESSAVMTYLS